MTIRAQSIIIGHMSEMKAGRSGSTGCPNEGNTGGSGSPSLIGERYLTLRRNFVAQHGQEAFNRTVDDSLWREAGIPTRTEIVPVEPPQITP